MLKAFPDNHSLKLAFESGELDLAFGLSNEMAEELKENDFTTYDYPAGYQYYNFLNLERPHLENLEFRKALNFFTKPKRFYSGASRRRNSYRTFL